MQRGLARNCYDGPSARPRWPTFSHSLPTATITARSVHHPKALRYTLIVTATCIQTTLQLEEEDQSIEYCLSVSLSFSLVRSRPRCPVCVRTLSHLGLASTPSI